VIERASATCSEVTLLTPICRIRPSSRSSTRVSSGLASEPACGPCASPSRRLRGPARRGRGGRGSLSRLGAEPRVLVPGASPLLIAGRSDLGRDVQPVVVRAECVANQPVGDVGSVGVAGVDVAQAELDCLAEDCQCSVVIGGRSHDAPPCELHGAEAEPRDLQIPERPGAAWCG
jgi:hypothetical protein